MRFKLKKVTKLINCNHPLPLYLPLPGIYVDGPIDSGHCHILPRCSK